MTASNSRKLKHFEYSFFRNRLEELDWRPYYEITEPDVARELLYRMLIEVIDRYYPFTTFKNVPVRAAWLNSDLFEFMVRHDDAFATARSTKCY